LIAPCKVTVYFGQTLEGDEGDFKELLQSVVVILMIQKPNAKSWDRWVA
jgi:hypothetical protein